MPSLDYDEVKIHIPVKVIFTHSEKKLARIYRKFGITQSDAHNITSDARTTHITNGSDGYFIVYMKPCLDWSAAQDVALLAHEATHVMQYYFEDIGEESPGIEAQAYVVQFVTEYLVERHFRWKKKRLEHTQ